MISYELAKELKEAGFPVRPYPDWALAKDGPTAEAEYQERYIPALDELIAAFGSRFSCVHLYQGEWVCGYIDDNGRYLCGKGASPAEAVARLWLLLHANPPVDTV